MSKKDFATPAHQSRTPRGTPPQPTRRATKHKRVEYGKFLIARAAARRARRAAGKALAAKAAAIVAAGKKAG